MTVTLLPREIEELDAVRAAVSEAVFNAWFDQSDIKARIKKACMHKQRLRCCYCKHYADDSNSGHWELEHVLSENGYPQFFGHPGNLALACSRCNNAKSHTDVYCPQPRPIPRLEILPTSSVNYTIPHPNFDNWDDHLRHVDFKIYLSDSPKGTELLSVCKLNKKAVEDGGLNYESAVAALRMDYTAIFGDVLDTTPTDADVIARMTGITTRDHDRAAKLTLIGVSRALETMGRIAARRDHAKSIADAVRIGKEIAEKAAVKKKAKERLELLGSSTTLLPTRASLRKRPRPEEQQPPLLPPPSSTRSLDTEGGAGAAE